MMFNVGLMVAIRPAPNPLKITNRYLPQYNSGTDGLYSVVQLWRTGELRWYNAAGAANTAPGEWYGSPVGVVGDTYEFRYINEAGYPQNVNPLAEGEWTRLNSNYGLGWASSRTGRFRLEIREMGSGRFLTSAQYWNNPSYAP